MRQPATIVETTPSMTTLRAIPLLGVAVTPFAAGDCKLSVQCKKLRWCKAIDGACVKQRARFGKPTLPFERP